MKTVWVNRFNADGTFKPMSEWACKEVNSKITHSEAVEGNRSKFFIFSANEAKKSGLSNLEYIGDQRGDGWLYVADGDLPPIENHAILCHDDVGVRLMMPEALHKPNTWEHQNKVKCWQPIQPPKHLD